MKIGQKFNKLTLKEYFYIIDNHKKYIDFNTLGLYRSILENEKLTLEQKIELREYAHQKFQKIFDFLQLKDPKTYVDIMLLGEEITTADKNRLWEQVIINQEKILKNKRIKHRNFGVYAKHECGYPTCPYDGMMVRQGSKFAESTMQFDSDKGHCPLFKSQRLRKERKATHQMIKRELKANE
jgi:hypothetical protein